MEKYLQQLRILVARGGVKALSTYLMRGGQVNEYAMSTGGEGGPKRPKNCVHTK